MELLTATMACHHHQSGSSYVLRTVQYGALRGRGNGGMESQEIRLSHVNMSRDEANYIFITWYITPQYRTLRGDFSVSDTP